ncbi:MAG: hypothetical protein DDT31_00518 [Syntrophomonadaceae bacterium]|nr:hypothetical protein [Bacillota bacterium]
MAVSVSNTAYGIIQDAMYDAGLLQEGEDPNSEQLSIYMRRLCDIINLWQTDGIKLFLLREITIPLIANQAVYTINNPVGVFPRKHLQVIQGRIVAPAPSTSIRVINPISWQQWNTLQRNPGIITGYLVDKQQDSLVVSFWQTPTATEALNSVVLLVRTQANNPFNLESNVLFPQEWRIALRWGLADDICTGQPQAIMDRCQQRALIYKTQLEDWDVEDAETTFAPNLRGSYNTGAFQ